MKIYKRGEGEPEFTVAGSLHGDEPAGKNAIEKFLEEDHNFQKPVQFIIANEKALEQEERFVDADLNRSFPGDSESENYEERLASKIMQEVEGTKLLDIHTTRSYPLAFGTFCQLNEVTRDLMKSTAVKNAVLFPEHNGTMHGHVNGVVVEAGFQGTDMAEMNALGVIKNFLSAQGAIEGEFRKSDPEIFEYTGTVEGDWNFLAQNFKLVEEGEVYAEKEGEKLKAEEDFYPVLMSTNGYDGQLGFKSRKRDKSKH